MTALTYRTTDGTKWGGGLGTDLSASQIDNNFWELYSMVTALQDHAAMSGAMIAYFAITGSNLYVHLTDHTVLGPYQLPTAQWNFRGAWLPATSYATMDVVTDAGAVYLVLFNHTAAGTFNAGAGDGLGHSYYGLLLANPANIIPTGGTPGQRLVKSTTTDFDSTWKNDTRNISVYIGQPPVTNELLCRYISPDIITLPASLTGSECSSKTLPTANTIYTLQKNGAAVGFVQFNAGLNTFSFSFTGAVVLNPGDYLDIIGPATPDITHANFTIVLVANITG